DALVADVHRGPGDELGDLVLSTPAEGAFDHLRTSDLLAHPATRAACGGAGRPLPGTTGGTQPARSFYHTGPRRPALLPAAARTPPPPRRPGDRRRPGRPRAPPPAARSSR